ncbi:MAG: YdeI/OmpD-associated family protein [Candidatus Buchananbacteria bacterium]|nr:YdeI/OmpD-associated family protein [Candidatus Buchananbacteria bacterium]
MTKQTIATGVVHSVPADLRLALQSSSATLEKWNNLTSLARNEWICWVTFVKQVKTRQEHIERLIKEVKAGKRRPCCWIGCIHRKDKAISPSIKAVLEKRLGRTK